MKRAWNIFFSTLFWLFSCYQLHLAFTTGTLISKSSDVSISDWSAPLFVVLFLLNLMVFLLPFCLAGAWFHKKVMSYGGNYNINTIKRVIWGAKKIP